MVAAGLLAPPLVLAVAVWPASAGDAGGGGGGSGETSELAVGEEADGSLGAGGVTSYEITAEEPGPVRIDVIGRSGDPTLTVVDDDGSQLGFNDDTDGLDSSLELDLEAGQVVRAEVRSFSGEPLAFTIRVATGGGGDAGGSGDPGPGPVTTVPPTVVPATVEPRPA